MNALFDTRDELDSAACSAKFDFYAGNVIDVETYAEARDVLRDLVDQNVWRLIHAHYFHELPSGEDAEKAKTFMSDFAQQLDDRLDKVWQAAAARRKA